MAKFKFVFDPNTINKMSFSEGWGLGVSAVKSVGGHLAAHLRLMMVFGVAIMLMVIPIIGWIFAAIRSQQLMVAAMRFERSFLNGRTMSVGELVGLIIKPGGLTKMSLVGALGVFVMIVASGILGVAASIMVGASSGSRPARVVVVLIFLAILIVFAVFMSALSLGCWRVGLQNEEHLAYGKIKEIVARTWPALLGVTLPAALISNLITAITAITVMMVMMAPVFVPSLVASLLNVVLGLVNVGFYGAAVGQGYHLMARKAMMRKEPMENEKPLAQPE